MKLHVGEVARTPGAESVAEFSEPLPTSEGFHPIGLAHGQLRVRNTGDVLSVDGEVHARVRLRCARCLEPFDASVHAQMQEVAEITSGGGARNVPDAWPETTVIDEAEQTVNVTELVRQSLLAVLPLRHVCRAACRGLCPYCGVNRNVVACACQPPRRETPLIRLGELVAQRASARD